MLRDETKRRYLAILLHVSGLLFLVGFLWLLTLGYLPAAFASADVSGAAELLLPFAPLLAFAVLFLLGVFWRAVYRVTSALWTLLLALLTFYVLLLYVLPYPSYSNLFIALVLVAFLLLLWAPGLLYWAATAAFRRKNRDGNTNRGQGDL